MGRVLGDLGAVSGDVVGEEVGVVVEPDEVAVDDFVMLK